MNSFLNRNYIILSVIILLALSLIPFIETFGVDVIYLDDWTLVDLVKRVKTEGFNYSIFFQQHNEHRLFFPKILYLASVPLTHMNSKIYMYVNMAMIWVEFLILISVANSQIKFSLSKIPVYLIIVPLFVFNFRQWQNLLWTFQIAFYMVLIFALLSFYLLEKSDQYKFGLFKVLLFLVANVCAIISTFSSAMGCLVWIAGATILIFKQIGKKTSTIDIILFITWLLIGASCFLLYFNSLIGAHNFTNEDFKIKQVWDYVYFFFCLLSMTSVHQLQVIAFPIGLGIFSISIFVLYKLFKLKQFRENTFWIAVYIYSLIFSLITTFGRYRIVFEYTSRSRYTIFTALFFISTFILTYKYYLHLRKSDIQENKIKLAFNTFFSGLIILALIQNTIGVLFGIKQKNEKEMMKKEILEYKSGEMHNIQIIETWISDEFVEKMEELAPFLEENGYSVFYKSENR